METSLCNWLYQNGKNMQFDASSNTNQSINHSGLEQISQNILDTTNRALKAINNVKLNGRNHSSHNLNHSPNGVEQNLSEVNNNLGYKKSLQRINSANRLSQHQRSPQFSPNNPTKSQSFVVKGSENTRFQSLDDILKKSFELALSQTKNPKVVPANDVTNEFVTFNGETGILLNKQEIESWTGEIPISQYPINDDSEPQIIKKKSDQHLIYDQQIAIRYLRPPTPPPFGDLILREDRNYLPPPAPPLVIRQQPARPETPPPIVIREEPPPPPTPLPSQELIIPGKVLSPPPRQVVIERLPELPDKPRPIIIERWLAYNEPTRKVIYVKNQEPEPVAEKPKNLIIQWETPEIEIRNDYKDLGIARADPQKYRYEHGNSLKRSVELPDFVKKIQPPNGFKLASQQDRRVTPQLEGDIEALRLVDLDREDLVGFKKYVKPKQDSRTSSPGSCEFSPRTLSRTASQTAFSKVSKTSSRNGTPLDVAFLNYFLGKTFSALDSQSGLKIKKSDAYEIFSTLSKDIGVKNISNEELRSFVDSFDYNGDGFIDFKKFKRFIIRSLIDHEKDLLD